MSEITVPSGQTVTLQEVIAEPGQLRFRFVAPDLPAQAFEAAETDMAALCETVARPAAEAEGIDAIVISVAERAIDFGVSDPDVLQYFEAFSVTAEGCVRDLF